MKRFAGLLLASLALVVTVAACGGDDSTSTSSKAGAVTVKDNYFSPKSASVKVGDTVTWTFTGGSAHNVTFDDFNSKLMKSGTYTHTFAKAGSFEYRCTIHTGMKGTVDVTDSAAP
jgi:plastocyanin